KLEGLGGPLSNYPAPRSTNVRLLNTFRPGGRTGQVPEAVTVCGSLASSVARNAATGRPHPPVPAHGTTSEQRDSPAPLSRVSRELLGPSPTSPSSVVPLPPFLRPLGVRPRDPENPVVGYLDCRTSRS